MLDACFGSDVVDAEMRRYLEKIDGVPLTRIPGIRPLRLMLDQAAPEGFWFPRLGIGQLMDAMADAFVARRRPAAVPGPATAVAVPGAGGLRGHGPPFRPRGRLPRASSS